LERGYITNIVRLTLLLLKRKELEDEVQTKKKELK
jgi:hypothetical protein